MPSFPSRALGTALALGAMACEPSLPVCDPGAARAVVTLDAPSDVTDDDGLPMTEGQALLHLSCGAGAYCHSAEAEGALRAGVPRGLDFDLGLPCLDAACAPDDERLARFEAHLAYVREHARELYGAVSDGSMPPGAIGRRVLARAGTARRPAPDGTPGQGDALPSLATDEGRRIFGNWLACGAPVVRTALPADAAHAPGSTCDATGECVTRAPSGATAPAPTFDELYAHVFGPLCAEACHGADAPHVEEPRFGDADATYAALLAPDDEPLVTPSDLTESHVLYHLTGTGGHALMPEGLLTEALPEAVVDSVRAWIASGAAR